LAIETWKKVVNTPITSDFSLENPSVDQNVLIEVLKKQKAEGVSECLDILEKMNQKVVSTLMRKQREDD